jgi:hypothetical protein
MLFGCSLMMFIMAADEQSVISSGLPLADRIRLQDLIVHGLGKNKHVELQDFYFGKQFIFTTQLVNFNEVYLPVFPAGQPETAGNLKILVYIRNDRQSNEPLMQTREELNRFVAKFNRYPGSVTGVLRPLTDNRVRTLTSEAYSGTDTQSLQVLWARDFPTQDSVLVLWSICAAFLVASAVCLVAYRRSRGQSGDTQIVLDITAAEAAAGKEIRVTIPEGLETITVKIPVGARNGTRLRFRGKSRPGKTGKAAGDLYIVLNVK